MDISLTPDLEQLVHKMVESGMYPSASEVIQEALRLLEERVGLRQARLDELREEIRIGMAQIEQGQYTEYDEGSLPLFIGRIQAAGRKKLAEEHGEALG